MQDVIFGVEWKGGKITGFNSKREAERYIECICKKVAGHNKYLVYGYYRLPSTKSR